MSRELKGVQIVEIEQPEEVHEMDTRGGARDSDPRRCTRESNPRRCTR
jgi:hypothetical protein